MGLHVYKHAGLQVEHLDFIILLNIRRTGVSSSRAYSNIPETGFHYVRRH